MVSIVTVVRNGRQSLERTIRSVLDQSYRPIEYIIIDGGSTDGTIEIIRKHAHRLSHWVSEPDNGISDAFNKGIRASTGGFIALVNCDDRLSPDQIELGVRALQKCDADYVFGDLLFHDENGEVLYRINGDPDYTRIIRSKMPEVCHPTVLARRSTYDRYGLFDTRYRYAMDYEWVLRVHVQGGRGAYAPGIVGHMGLGGASDVSFRKALKEVRDISIRHGRNVAAAEVGYRLRLVKGSVRRLLERHLSQGFFDRLRRMINPRYSRETDAPGQGKR